MLRKCLNNPNNFSYICGRQNKRGITYADLESARRPIPHRIDVPVPVLLKLIHFASTESTSASEELNEQYVCSGNPGTPETFTQTEQSDLVRD